MARLLGTNNFFSGDNPPITATPFSWFAWIYPLELPSVTGDEHTYFYLSNGTFSNFFNLRGDDGNPDQLQFNRRLAAGTVQSATTTNTIQLNQWNSISCSTANAADATVILNRDIGGKGTNGNSVVPAGINNFKLGSSVSTDYAKCYMTLPFMWDIALSDDEQQALHRRLNPWKMHPRNIAHAWDLRKRNGGMAIDRAYNHFHLTENGTVFGKDDPGFIAQTSLDKKRIFAEIAAIVEGDGSNIIFF